MTDREWPGASHALFLLDYILSMFIKPAVASFACVVLLAGCASPVMEAPIIARAPPPNNYQKSIATYFDLTIKGPQKNRELDIGKPEPGGCPVGGHITSQRGWVVPVIYATRTGNLTGKEAINITGKAYYFWFREDTIYGVTPKPELCP
jgi:hypothetical protein